MSYRDDADALRLRRATLAAELEATRERLGEVPALLERTGALEQEIARLEEALRTRQSTLLSRVRVASPCSARWEAMSGDERARHCSACDKTVYDLSALTADAAEALLRERGEGLCVRLFRRADGTVLTADCPVGGRRRRRRALMLFSVGAAVSSVAAAASVSVWAPAQEPRVAYESRSRSRGSELLGAVWVEPVDAPRSSDDELIDATNAGRTLREVDAQLRELLEAGAEGDE